MAGELGDRKAQALSDYQKKLLSHKEVDAKVRTLRDQVSSANNLRSNTRLIKLSCCGNLRGRSARTLCCCVSQVKASKTEYDKTEDDLKALQSVGQIIGEVLRQLDEERCAPLALCVRHAGLTWGWFHSAF